MPGWTPNSVLAKAVFAAGFSYDDKQDIIFSRMDALQRNLGYAYGYDDLAYLISAEIDCEPIFFDYPPGKTWMIELWKGQYGLMTGCEIGVYNRFPQVSPIYTFLDATVGKRPHDPVKSHSMFFDCAGNDELLEMSFTLSRRGQKLFSRGSEKHWWLTGFKWGELSSPDDLSMEVNIKFPNHEMRELFKKALIDLKYGYNPVGDGIYFTFPRPQTFQPRNDPSKRSIFDKVRSSNKAIVSTYKQLYQQLGLTSNNPNGITGELERKIVDYITQYGPAFFTQALAQLSTLSEWIGSLEERLGLKMDYSCRVQIENAGNQYELVREAFGVSPGGDGRPCGEYIVNPPEKIAPGGTGRFWIRDFPGFHGAEGWVGYYYIDSNRQKHSFRFEYGCPTGIYKNYARAQSPFNAWLKEGDMSSNWEKEGKQPLPGRKLHPLTADFVWGQNARPRS